MKSILYVSKVSTNSSGPGVPTGLSQMLRLAREKNEKLEITGGISYRNGRFLQVIEGSNESVDELYKTIAADERHTDVEVILDFYTPARYFPSTYMALIESTKNNFQIKAIIEKNIDTIEGLDQHKLELLRRFYNLDDHKTKSDPSFYGKDLSLTAWPNFLKIEATPEVFELSARLKAKPISYESLLELDEFDSKAQLDKLLNEFDSLGILVAAVSSNDKNSRTSKPTSEFYSKMKKFLRLR